MDKTGFSPRLRRSPEPSRALRRQRQRRTASVLVMAVLSAAWTVQIARPFDAGAGPDASSGASDRVAVELPQVEPEQPASLASPRGQGPWTVPRGNVAVPMAARSTSGVPSIALAAYQRAESVITLADATCGADWALLAAIGQVESDHGRIGDNVVGLDGISRPGVFGIPLDGTRRTQEISDTDGGRLDRDVKWDRAVGPMQFIPETWREVAVDADGDGRRDPQDIDDAALASAVYLCAGEGDLTAASGRRAALLRYNHSEKYGDLVLRVRAVYLERGAGADVGFAGGAVPALSAGQSPVSGGVRAGGVRLHKGTDHAAKPQPAPSKDAAPQSPDEPRDEATPSTPLKKVAHAVDEVVAPVLSGLQATVRCASQGLDILLDATAWARCFEKLTSP